MERGVHQVGHYCRKRDITEIRPDIPIIHGISAFQIHRIYQETLLQYSPNPSVLAPCSDISRGRNSSPKSPNSENSPSFCSCTPITTFHYNQNFLEDGI